MHILELLQPWQIAFLFCIGGALSILMLLIIMIIRDALDGEV